MIISKKVVTLCNYCVFSFSEIVPVNLSTASSIIYTWWSVSRRRLSLSSWERGSSELFVVYFNLIARWIQPSACQLQSQHCCGGGGDRMLNIARKTTLTLVISRHAAQKISKGSYFMSSLELVHLLASRQYWMFLNLSGWRKLRLQIQIKLLVSFENSKL